MIRLEICLRESVARAICAADKLAPDADATIMLGMRKAKAWEARLPMADAAIAVMTDQQRLAEQKAEGSDE